MGTEPNRFMEPDQARQHTQNGNLKEREQRGVERVFKEMMAENSPNLVKGMNLHIQEAQQSPSRINSKIVTPRHVIIQPSKSKRES